MLKTVLAAALSNLRPSAMAATGRSLHGLAKQQAPTFGPLPQLHQAALKPCRPVVLACSACSDQPSTSGAHRQHWQFPAAWSASARHVSTRADKVDFKRVYRKPRLQPVAAAASDFYAPDTTFASLGLDEDVVAALNRAGFTQPSRIQVCACSAKHRGPTRAAREALPSPAEPGRHSEHSGGTFSVSVSHDTLPGAVCRQTALGHCKRAETLSSQRRQAAAKPSRT